MIKLFFKNICKLIWTDDQVQTTAEEEMPKKPIVIQMPLLNFRAGWPSKPDIAIIHYSSGYSVKSCHDTLAKRKLSVHNSVERDGKVYQHLDYKNRGLHAGYGQWGGKGNMNGRSFGVEVINFGWGFEGTGELKYNKFGPTKDELKQDDNGSWHRVETYMKNGKEISTRVITKQKMSKFPDHREEHQDKLWSEFTKEQIDSTHWLIWEWMSQNPNIILENVLGHEHVTPHRKTDPGPAWPWRKTELFLQDMALKERPELLDFSHKTKERIRAVQSHIHRCGIDIGNVDGVWGNRTKNGVLKMIKDYSETYALNLSTKDAVKEESLKLSNAFRLIPGFQSK